MTSVLRSQAGGSRVRDPLGYIMRLCLKNDSNNNNVQHKLGTMLCIRSHISFREVKIMSIYFNS